MIPPQRRLSRIKTIPLTQQAPQQELGSSPPVKHSTYKYFQIALLKRRGNPGRVIHRPHVLDQENESGKGQIPL